MMKYIYKITNNINNKIYIGQSNNPERRWNEHVNGYDNYISLISQAIHKYGKEAFTYEIIEETEDYDKREQYWISYYNTTNRIRGYNRADGGSSPPIITGEDSVFCKYTDDFVAQLQNDLLNTAKNYHILTEEYGVSEYYISLINRGVIRKNSNYNYPIRRSENERKSQEVIVKLEHDLQYTTKTIVDIAKNNQVSESLVSTINLGKHFYSSSDIDFPIRLPYQKISNYMVQKIIEELKQNQYQLVQLAEIYNLSYPTLSRINRGLILKQDNENYPIRSSSQRVYKPVETIPS